jgi:hypothetical protein
MADGLGNSGKREDVSCNWQPRPKILMNGNLPDTDMIRRTAIQRLDDVHVDRMKFCHTCPDPTAGQTVSQVSRRKRNGVKELFDAAVIEGTVQGGANAISRREYVENVELVWARDEIVRRRAINAKEKRSWASNGRGDEKNIVRQGSRYFMNVQRVGVDDEGRP